MSIARHHAEWLSLVEVSGPFLSLPVLMRAFPQGLENIDPGVVQNLRTAYDEWQEDLSRRARAATTHRAWIAYVLSAVLEFPDAAIAEGQSIPDTLKAIVPEHGETLRPTHVVRDPADGKPRMLVVAYPPDQNLERPAVGKRWKVSPSTRMTELLHATGVRLGLVTNGDHWMMVDAPRDDTAGFTSWYAELWFEERLTLRAFRSLLGAPRFFGVAPKDTIEALLADSAENQQEVTDQLGYQVRKAVEVLVEALDGADQDHNRKLLAGVSETEIYEAALTVMMRLVFLFCAEERSLLLLGDPLFDQHYAVSPLREQLREAADLHGEEILERRRDAWCRLLATFRAVHGGVRHERMTIPPYGGALFDPDRFPFLEGRERGKGWRESTADPLPINNRTVLHLLEALQLLQVKVPGGGSAEARRLSYRALDIEQIGHVYEGLLDHTAKRATELMLGLVGSRDKTRDFEPEVPLSQLEALATKGRPALIDYLARETHRSSKAIEKQLDRRLSHEDEHRFLVSCGSDADAKRLLARDRPFANLIRDNSFGHPVVIQPGSVYVTEGTDRRSTGTQYTPRSLTEPIVQHALEPLVYEGPAEGKPPGEWKLRSARELLDLAICDFACGSGAFLVQACRYLAARLLEAWEAIESQHPGLVRITPEGELSQGLPEERLIPKDPDERLVYAMRLVAQRCLYGVDVNPLAVEMAKLSLWLLTLAKEKPFTFLDHAVRCGDSLLGITTLSQLKRFSLSEGPVQTTIEQRVPFDELVDRAVAARLKLGTMDGDTVDHLAAKKALLAEAEEQIGRLKAAADLLIATEIGDVSRDEAIHAATNTLQMPTPVGASQTPRGAARRRRSFHWPLEFPEVMAKHDGFCAFIGNPPFVGGLRLETAFGGHWREHVVRTIGNNIRGHRGTADLCAYFLLRANRLLRSGGTFGMVTTNSISEGDTRTVGLEQILSSRSAIIRARPSFKWPGAANLSVAFVWVSKGGWNGQSFIDGQPVPAISAQLAAPGLVSGPPQRLQCAASRSFMGATILGLGFTLDPSDAVALIAANSKNREVLFPHLVGEDINGRVDQSSSRWIINFSNLSLERARQYPDCIAIVEEKVRPERERLIGRTPEGTRRGTRWWLYAQDANKLFRVIAGMKQVLVRSSVSKHHAIAFLETGFVPSNTVVVFAFDDYASFAVLQSSIHEQWAAEYSSSLETRLRYTPTSCFETFVFPIDRSHAGDLGERYYTLRRQILQTRRQGLTKIYNRFHDPGECTADILKLRELHVQMDQAVAAAYAWNDLDLGHGFHETRPGVRFTISETTRREILDRLLHLNHERHADEVRRGLHAKGRTAKSGSPRNKGAGDADGSPLFS